jgi:group I intron endonuclease
MIPIQRELREAGATSGVYAIQHNGTNKSYVGSSKNIPKRIGEHFNKLRAGAHHSPALQNYWDSYGESDFTVLLLERCEGDELLKVEQIFIECMGTLNGSKFAIPGKMKQLPESRSKRSKSLTGVKRNSKGKTYLEIYGTDTPTCGFQKGVVLSSEIYEKLSEATKLAWAEGRMKGTPKSPETRAKMAASRKLYWERKRNANS